MSTFEIDGTPVNRLGYGTMQLPGDGVWGFAKDPENAKAVLRRAVELGVQMFDTADSATRFASSSRRAPSGPTTRRKSSV